MTTGTPGHDFFQTLQIQRDDDHRYNHHSRINQSLHLLSGCTLVRSYALLAWAEQFHEEMSSDVGRARP